MEIRPPTLLNKLKKLKSESELKPTIPDWAEIRRELYGRGLSPHSFQLRNKPKNMTVAGAAVLALFVLKGTTDFMERSSGHGHAATKMTIGSRRKCIGGWPLLDLQSGSVEDPNELVALLNQIGGTSVPERRRHPRDDRSF